MHEVENNSGSLSFGSYRCSYICSNTVAALNDGNYNSNTASSSNRGPYWYGEGEEGYREGRESGMINLWGAQNGTGAYFDDNWIGMG